MVETLVTDKATVIEAEKLTPESTDAEIGAALRPHLAMIQRRLAEDKQRFQNMRDLHGPA